MDEYVINPRTNRRIKIGGPTFNKLTNAERTLILSNRRGAKQQSKHESAELIKLGNDASRDVLLWRDNIDIKSKRNIAFISLRKWYILYEKLNKHIWPRYEDWTKDDIAKHGLILSTDDYVNLYDLGVGREAIQKYHDEWWYYTTSRSYITNPVTRDEWHIIPTNKIIIGKYDDLYSDDIDSVIDIEEWTGLQLTGSRKGELLVVSFDEDDYQRYIDELIENGAIKLFAK